MKLLEQILEWLNAILVPPTVWLNTAANTVGRWLLVPVAIVPGWVSATVIGVVTGVVLLAIFKYTSNQKGIKRVRDRINANLLAIWLFMDNALVTLRAQGGLLFGGCRLFLLALVPMLVMLPPVVLIMGQMSLWYEQRPVKVGEDALVVVTLKSNSRSAVSLAAGCQATRWLDEMSPMPEARLVSSNATETVLGPMTNVSEREVRWYLKGKENGYHQLTFQVGEQKFEKSLAVGDGFMRVSALRPAWDFGDVLLYPAEQPFPPDSIVQSIKIDYPKRDSWTSGSSSQFPWWIGYWLAVSMIAGFCSTGVLKVNI